MLREVAWRDKKLIDFTDRLINTSSQLKPDWPPTDWLNLVLLLNGNTMGSEILANEFYDINDIDLLC